MHPSTNQFEALQARINQQILGQELVVKQLVIALLANGHVLIQGLPGLAKTRAVNEMANEVKAKLNRIQFTPDMLPADITGSEVYSNQTQSISFKPGPVFSNFLLADEINRAPAKVQSALLESMAEAQVSVAGVSHPLPELFMVLATQNPIEQEGTYPLPEAQMDRFLMQILIDYPDKDAEKSMLKLLRAQQVSATEEQATLTVEEVLAARKLVEQVSVNDNIDQYIVDLVDATRQPKKYSDELATFIELGASPRATIALDRCARAHAWLSGRDFVSPEDVKAVCHGVLRHRMVLSFNCINLNMSSDIVIDKLLDCVVHV
ncbi:MoxR family ATPase [Shewanella schlegeliana]|uniref:MoxR family ATPase n=1 Tax=Shewanella schlegeliana TaxID=190308 RepID=A0ABS1T5S6_9GAMM|nr:MoxR family ATPase [Shewanella schlegeliana]MBL4915182.1 MoxR family ATPase [Shewanella schlegeliana]MCL1110950.1 MoxR family ATPase [Shewanella schlegeliana]GIU29478.1 ATPase [Shewanella schlegeliana]